VDILARDNLNDDESDEKTKYEPSSNNENYLRVKDSFFCSTAVP
jgi:hypothetical protein